ncbi:Sporadically distributed protein, TIGR04141 family [Acetobacteraceae bacterium EV16G]|uniref:Sporadically distributed protein, TIGR04141 family n=1 Tax=Sorlinia euscelidii TaxID=3081148 RepID=A0ABU7U2Y8_9PROT
MSGLKQITLFRIKNNTNFEVFLKGDLSEFSHIEPNGDFEGYIKFVKVPAKKANQDQIPWLRFLNSGLEKKFKFQASNLYPRAIMALKINGGNEENDVCYAAVFGQHGDIFLNKDHIVYDFGIKVAMNICDVEKLKRIQTTEHEAISRQTERQASIGTRLGVFNIDSETELLRKISGHVKEDFKSLIKTFQGKESISLAFPNDKNVDWTFLIDVCRKLEERFNSKDYTETELKVYDLFPAENDPVIIKELDRLLCKAIIEGNFDAIHLAPPHFLKDDDYSFCYRERGKGKNSLETFEDLNIKDLLKIRGRNLDDLDAPKLKKWIIFNYCSELDETRSLWNAYQCVVAEIERDGRSYILSSGQWREVSSELKATVNRYLKRLNNAFDLDYLPSDVNIFDRHDGKNHECIFNNFAAQKCPELYLFDRARLEIAGKKLYEMCDLLHSDRSIIHVKRFTSGSASINHIFTQGRFYAHAFVTEADCRVQMAKFVESDEEPINASKNKSNFLKILPKNKAEINEKEYCVVFCILHEKPSLSINDLPFMSQYEFMRSHRFLTEDRNFKVSVVFRKVTTGN